MGALKFRVLLDSEKDKEIFRDIIIDENDNFESLFQTIMKSFNFQGEEMASFYMSNDNWDKGHEISLVDINYGDEAIDEKASLMSQAIISEFIEVEDQKIILVYDFMRMWIFLLELVERVDKIITTPEVALSVGMAPPEDSKNPTFEEEEDNQYFDEDDEEDDEFGFNDYEDGFDSDDYSNYDDY
jgi:hypothetical protein